MNFRLSLCNTITFLIVYSLLIICTYHCLVKLFCFVIFLHCSQTTSLKLADLLFLAPSKFLYTHTILAIVISFCFCLSGMFVFVYFFQSSCALHPIIEKKLRMIMWIYECLHLLDVRALVLLLYSFFFSF